MPSIRKRTADSIVGIESNLLNAADTSTIVNANANIALLTPSGSPGVLDDPVVNAVDLILAPADDGNTVISINTALV